MVFIFRSCLCAPFLAGEPGYIQSRDLTWTDWKNASKESSSYSKRNLQIPRKTDIAMEHHHFLIGNTIFIAGSVFHCHVSFRSFFLVFGFDQFLRPWSKWASGLGIPVIHRMFPTPNFFEKVTGSTREHNIWYMIIKWGNLSTRCWRWY